MKKVSYAALDPHAKFEIEVRLETRRVHYLRALKGRYGHFDGVLLVGDKPGPSAPQDPGYHHTPFYSTKHCSGWLNALLHVEGIPEEALVWVNSADKDGNPTDPKIVKKLNPDLIVALGGNAEKWLKKNGIQGYVKVDHPQAHKRFKNAKPYPLMDILRPLRLSDEPVFSVDFSLSR